MTKDSSFCKVGLWRIVEIVCLCVPILLILLILNWFFKITPFQRMEGLAMLLPTFTCPIGFLFGIIAFTKLHSKTAVLAIVINGVLFFVPSLYFILGTLLFGP